MGLGSKIKAKLNAKLTEAQLNCLFEACWAEGHKEAYRGPRQGKMTHEDCKICDVISELASIPR